eukprot:Selendium_serpulae@DN2042_c0_g1_i1.p1
MKLTFPKTMSTKRTKQKTLAASHGGPGAKTESETKQVDIDLLQDVREIQELLNVQPPVSSDEEPDEEIVILEKAVTRSTIDFVLLLVGVVSHLLLKSSFFTSLFFGLNYFVVTPAAAPKFAAPLQVLVNASAAAATLTIHSWTRLVVERLGGNWSLAGGIMILIGAGNFLVIAIIAFIHESQPRFEGHNRIKSKDCRSVVGVLT